MKKFERVVLNSATGLPVNAPTITVYHAGTVVVATIYSDEGTTTKANPFTGDSLGRYNFYAPDGDYDIKIEGTGLTTTTLSDVTIQDSKRGGYVFTDDVVNVALANAAYNRQTAAWNRISTARPAWNIEADAVGANDYLRVLHAVAAANPITWTELLRIKLGGELLAGAGAVALPSLSFLGDPDTGFWSQAANVLALSTGAVERVRFENAFQLRLRQATFDLILAWNNPAALRTLTIPDPGGNDTFVFLAATQTLTGKTLTNPIIAALGPSGAQQHTVPAVTSDTIALLAASQVFTSKAGVPFDVMGATGATNLATTGTEFLTLSGILAPNATEANVELIAHGAGALLGLRVRLSAAPTGGANSHIFTIRVNGVDTAAVVTINDLATTGTWTGSIAYAAGDRLSLKHTVAGTPAAATAQHATRRRETAV